MARLFDDAQSEYLLYGGAVLSSVPITMACWFYSDSLTLNQALITIADTDALHDFDLTAGGDVAGDPVYARAHTGGAAVRAVTSIGYSANTWHHACGVFAAVNDRRAFIDGGNKGTNATSKTPANLDNTVVGALKFNSSLYWKMSGRIAWPAIWNVALSDEEVASLAAGTHPNKIRPDKRVSFCPLGGLDGEHDKDIWGGYDMTPQNGPSWADHPGGLIYPSRPLVFPSAAAPAGHAGRLVNSIRLKSKLQGLAA